MTSERCLVDCQACKALRVYDTNLQIRQSGSILRPNAPGHTVHLLEDMALSQRAQQLRSLTDFALWTALRATAAENWLYATSPAITLHSGIDRRPLSSALLPTDKPKHLSGLLRQATGTAFYNIVSSRTSKCTHAGEQAELSSSREVLTLLLCQDFPSE